MKATKRAPSAEAIVVGRYKREALPFLRELGFEGTFANMSLVVGRASLLAFVSRSGGQVTLGVTGNDGRGAFSVAHASFGADAPAKEVETKMSAYVASLRKALAARVAKFRRERVPEAPASLAQAASALLAWLTRDRDFAGIAVEKVVVKGRRLIVHARDRAEPITVDRSELVTLLRELRAGKRAVVGRDLRYALHGRELDAYLDVIAKADRDEARALWVHLCSPYDVPGAGHRLGYLFPKPLALAAKLNRAASAGALVTRALPYASNETGDPLDRLVAIRIAAMMLGSVHRHRKRDAIFADAGALATALARDPSPIVRESAWMLRARLDELEPNKEEGE